MTMTDPTPGGAFVGPLEPSSDGVVWGACASASRRLGVSVETVRAVVVFLSVCGGFGLLVYGALGLWSRTPERVLNPPHVSRDVGLAVAAAGTAWQLSGWWPGVSPTLVVPVGLVGTGMVLGWRSPDVAGTAGADSGVAPTERAKLAPALVRVAGGAVLCLAGLAVVLGQRVPIGQLRDTGLAIAVALGGVAVVMGPTAIRLGRSLGAERDARVRSHERAAVAAHLHDSVLQTLTLIQKRSDDPATIAALARHQERSLRRWLYGGGEVAASLEGLGWRGRAEQIAAELEDQYLVAIELVMVGDGDATPSIDAALAAAREAMVNSAKFSGVDTIDVFCERSDGRFEVFVRDRGKGFDMGEVADDRRGIRDSIVGRIERVGGRAHIRSEIGEGTEVHVEVPQ